MQYRQFVRYRPCGEWESFRVPHLFGIADVATHCAHCVLFVRIPRGQFFYAANHEKYEGPCWAVYDPTQDDFVARFETLEAAQRTRPADLWALVP